MWLSRDGHMLRDSCDTSIDTLSSFKFLTFHWLGDKRHEVLTGDLQLLFWLFGFLYRDIHFQVEKFGLAKSKKGFILTWYAHRLKLVNQSDYDRESIIKHSLIAFPAMVPLSRCCIWPILFSITDASCSSEKLNELLEYKKVDFKVQ